MASTAFCASGPNPQPRNYGSNLLSIPTELRGMLYSYFLKHSTNVDVPDDSVIAKIDLSLLQICRQMRNEALEYLLGTNSWTRLTADYNQVDLSIALKALLHLDVNLFAGKEREQIVSNAVLHIHIGDSLPYKYYATTRACDDYLVHYSVGFRVRLPKILISPSYGYSFERVISININLTDRKQGEAENLLLSLANIRGWFGVSEIEVIGAQSSALVVAVRDAMAGQNTQFEHFYEHMLALKEEGDEMYTQGHFRAAVAIYTDALRVYDTYRFKPWPFKKRLSPAHVKAIDFLGVDLANNFGMVSSLVLEQSRKHTGQLPSESIHLIEMMLAMKDYAFTRWDLSDAQRIEAHFRNAIAMEKLAEYLSTPGYREYVASHSDIPLRMLTNTNTLSLLNKATAEYFYAWQVDVNSAIADKMRTHYVDMSYHTGFYMMEDPELVTLDNLWWTKDGTWTGAPSLSTAWTEGMMKSWLPVDEMRRDGYGTQEKLMATRSELGLRESHQGGLVRLLRLSAVEDDEVTDHDETDEYDGADENNEAEEHNELGEDNEADGYDGATDAEM